MRETIRSPHQFTARSHEANERGPDGQASVIGLSKHVRRTAFIANVSAFWNLISERGILAV